MKGAGRATRKAATTVAGAAGTVKEAAGAIVEKVSEKMPFGEKPENAS